MKSLNLFIAVSIFMTSTAARTESDYKPAFTKINKLGDLAQGIQDVQAAAFFKKKIKGSESAALRIQAKSDVSFVVNVEGQNIPLEIKPEADGRFNFLINQKPVAYEAGKDTPEQFFERIEHALPKQTASLFGLVFPEAHAIGAAGKAALAAMALFGIGMVYLDGNVGTRCNRLMTDLKKYCEGDKLEPLNLEKSSKVVEHIMGAWNFRKRCENFTTGDYKNITDRLVSCLHRAVESGHVDEAKIYPQWKKYYGIVPFTAEELATGTK